MEQWEIDILKEVEEEFNRKEEERKNIIKNGCPHTEKVERIGLFTKKRFLECKICFKQFWMDGTEIIY